MNFNKIALVTGLVVSGIAVSGFVAPVEAAATFNLSFYGGISGFGQFTDSQGPLTCFPTSTNPNDCGPMGSSQVYVTHTVSNFQATIGGTTWTSLTGWYADPSISQGPGSIGYSQYGPTLVPNAWVSQTGYYRQLLLSFSSAGPNSLSGSFTASLNNGQTISGVFQGGLGSTDVPEPLNILGALTSLALFGTVSTALKRRKLTK